VYTGHFAVALAAAGRARTIPLWLLIVAAFASDLAEGVVAAFGVGDPTRVWSHSVPAAVGAGLVLAVTWRITGGSWRAGGIIVLTSASHTLLDFTTAVKTVWPGARPMGMHLYSHAYLDFLVEGGVCVLGWAVWRASLPPEQRHRRLAWAALGTLLIAQAIASAHILLFGTIGDPDALSKFVR
jgi:hypothetical protein